MRTQKIAELKEALNNIQRLVHELEANNFPPGGVGAAPEKKEIDPDLKAEIRKQFWKTIKVKPNN